MHNLSENFNKISMIVNEILKNTLNKDGNTIKPGPKPKFSDCDLISLALTSEALEIDSENNLFEILNNKYQNQFPNLIHRTQFNRRRKSLFPFINQVREGLVFYIEPENTRNIVDSMPMPICKFVRAKRIKICKEDYNTSPEYSYCASQKLSYYGYKLHAVCSARFTIKHFDLSKANHHDINYIQDIRDVFPNTELLGDLGYLSHDLQMELFESQNIRLITPMRRNQKGYVPQKIEYRVERKRIETIFSQLVDFLKINRIYSKSFTGLAVRTLTKITTFTLLQYINILNGRPQNHVKHALCY